MSAEACLKHPWLKLDEPSSSDIDLSANKQKIKDVPMSNNNYYFDSSSKTMSVAEDGGGGDDWEWEWYETNETSNGEDSKKAKNLVPKAADTLPQQVPEPLTVTKVGTKKAENVITHAQVQAKAAEIRTPVFAQIKTTGAECTPETAYPLQSPCEESHPVSVVPVGNHPTASSEIAESLRSAADTVYSAEISRPVQIVLTKTNSVAETAEQPPVWQAAERTLSPLYDVAKIGGHSSPSGRSAIAEINSPVQQFYSSPQAQAAQQIRPLTPPRAIIPPIQQQQIPKISQNNQQQNTTPYSQQIQAKTQQTLSQPKLLPTLPPRSPPQRMRSLAQQPTPVTKSQQIPISIPQHFIPQSPAKSPFQNMHTPAPTQQRLCSPPAQQMTSSASSTNSSAAGKKRRSDDCSSTSESLMDVWTLGNQNTFEGNFHFAPPKEIFTPNYRWRHQHSKQRLCQDLK